MTIFPAEIRAKISNSNNQILLFAMMRNEVFRLGAWLKHHRDLGCREIYVVDNGSTDGTYERLLQEPDVTVVQTLESFGAARSGVTWLNEFRAIAGPEKWVLFADADELLVYKGWPELGIDALVGQMEAAGCDTFWAYMLDMYPDGPIEPVDPPMEGDLFAQAPCFDSEYYFVFPPKKPWNSTHPGLKIVGGPRLRSLSSMRKELHITWVDRVLRDQLDRFYPITPAPLLPVLFRIAPQEMPRLFKSPIARAGTASRYFSNHEVSSPKYFKQHGIICHFKFLGDFSKRVHTEVERGEHYHGGQEYFRYLTLLKKSGTLDFRYDKTATFRSVQQLEALGLFTEQPVHNPLNNPV